MMYDSEGNVLSEYNREYGLIIRDGFVEQDARLWWELVKEGILHTVRESGENVVDGIAVSTQGIAVVPTDKTGEPLSDAISWLDLRSDRETDFKVRRGRDLLCDGKACTAYIYSSEAYVDEDPHERYIRFGG